MSDILDRIKGFVVKRSEVNPFSHVVEIEADEFNELIHALGAARDEIEQQSELIEAYESALNDIANLAPDNGKLEVAASRLNRAISIAHDPLKGLSLPTKDCGCYECSNDERRMTTMITCIYCGNKRCPKASNHIYDCTDSNEPGQPGSRYVSDKSNG